MLAGRVCLDVVLTRVAYVELLVRAVPLDLRDEQSLVDVFVPKVRARRLIYVLLIVVVKIDSLVVDQVFRLLVRRVAARVVRRVGGALGLRGVLLYELYLYFVDVAARV